MESIGDIGRWISENESLLSGTVALAVLAGLVISPLGKGIRRLYARRADSPAPDAAPGPILATSTPESSEPVLAVLAFDNLSSDPEMQFFSDGVSEEIIQRLSRGASIKVIGRTSSFQFRGERKADAARTLGSSHILDGSIRRAAGRVRISAHLVETSSQTTLWADRYDRSLEDIFSVQDEISENISTALDQTFSRFSVKAIDPAVYDLYLRASPQSYAPDELRRYVIQLETVTERAPDFAPGWARLSFLRSFLNFYQPFSERATNAALVAREADRALALDPQNIDAMTAQLFVIQPFGRFVEAGTILDRIRRAPGSGDGSRYMGWYLRMMGHISDSLEHTERTYRLDALDPMSANTVALARMASGKVAEAIPVYEDLVTRVPDMSFPVASLLRAYAFQEDWAAVDRLLALAEERGMREFQDTMPFVQAKRHSAPENIDDWKRGLHAQIEETGGIDVSRLVYSAHLGLIEEAYEVAETARLGPAGMNDDIMGPDAYRTSLLFQTSMPEMRNDPRFPRLCARLGLVEYWMTTDKWPDCADDVPYDFKAECEKVQNIPKEDFGF